MRRDTDWLTSSLWRFEFASALATMPRAKLLNETQAFNAMPSATIEMPLRQMDAPREQALLTVLCDGISAYDAQYIALAEMLNLRCITAGRPLMRKTPARSILPSDFVK